MFKKMKEKKQAKKQEIKERKDVKQQEKKGESWKAQVLTAPDGPDWHYLAFEEWRKEFEPTNEEKEAKRRADFEAKRPNLSGLAAKKADMEEKKAQKQLDKDAAKAEKKKERGAKLLNKLLIKVESSIHKKTTMAVLTSISKLFTSCEGGVFDRLDSKAVDAKDQAMHEVIGRPLVRIFNALSAIPSTFRFSADQTANQMQFLRNDACCRIASIVLGLFKQALEGKEAVQAKIEELKELARGSAADSKVQGAITRAQDAKAQLSDRKLQAQEKKEALLARLEAAGGSSILSADNPQGLAFATREVVLNMADAINGIIGDLLDSKREELVKWFSRIVGNITSKIPAGQGSKEAEIEQLFGMFSGMFSAKLSPVLDMIKEKAANAVSDVADMVAPKVQSVSAQAHAKLVECEAKIEARRQKADQKADEMRAKVGEAKERAQEFKAKVATLKAEAKAKAEVRAKKKAEFDALGDDAAKQQFVGSHVADAINSGYELLDNKCVELIHNLMEMIKGLADTSNIGDEE